MKVNMMVQRLVVALLVVALVGSVCAEDAKEVIVASAKEVKGISAKKITWKKDSAKMVLIPSTATFEQKTTFNRVGGPIVKAVEVKGPNPVPFYMDATEVTVGQFKKFVEESDYMGGAGKDCQHRHNGNSYQEVNRTDEVDTIYRSKNRVIFLRGLFPEFNFVLIHLQKEYCNDIRA